MTVTELFNGKEFLDLNDNKEFPEEFHEIIEYGILSSQVNPFDPMEKAINAIGERYFCRNGTSAYRLGNA